MADFSKQISKQNALAVAIALLAVADAARAQTAAFAATPTMPLAGGLAWDDHRGVTVVFERGTGRIWHWDGTEFRVQLGVTHTAGAVCTFDPQHRMIHTSTGGMWNGANWSFTTSPTLGGLGSIAFDAVRQRLVGVPGTNSPSVFEWDGAQWTTITPPASPGVGGSLAFDPSRGQVVLAIGNPLMLFTWDGAQWSLLDNSAPALPANPSYGLWFDPGNNRLVVHGYGVNPVVPLTLAFDAAGGWTAIATPASFTYGATLAYDGTGLLRLGASTWLPEGLWRLEGNVWRKLALEHPRTRTDPALASSPAQPGIVLFGGRAIPANSNTVLDDTWIFDGAWTRRQPAVSPPPRRDAGLAFSPANQAYLLYGGLDAQSNLLTDTWLWNGTAWAQQSPVNNPNEALRLATDPAGGVLGLPPLSLPTVTSQWQWTGTDWVKTQGPTAFWQNSFLAPGHDPVRNVVVAAVGSEVHEWDGASWTNLGNLPFPYTPSVSVTYRPDTQRMLFHGGGVLVEWDGASWIPANIAAYQTPPSDAAADHTRQRLFSFQHGFTGSVANGWNGAAAALTTTPAGAERFGFGCALGATPGLLTDGRPIPGAQSFGITATTLAPNAPGMLALGFATQPQHLGAGCVSWIAPPHAVQFLLADVGGTARGPIPIPAAGALRGVTFLAQSVVLDPQRSVWAGLTFSDGLRITLGD